MSFFPRIDAPNCFVGVVCMFVCGFLCFDRFWVCGFSDLLLFSLLFLFVCCCCFFFTNTNVSNAHINVNKNVLSATFHTHSLPYSTQNMSCLFLSLNTYLLNIMVPTTQTLSQIKSQEIIGHIHKHFITTSPLAYVTNGIQDIVFNSVSNVGCTSTFDPKTCYLVDYNQYDHNGESMPTSIPTLTQPKRSCSRIGVDDLGRKSS